MRDLYKILGIQKSATLDEIKKAYRKLAKKYHPDIIGNNEAARNKFQEISAAYQILENDEKRKKYDEELNGINNQNIRRNSTVKSSYGKTSANYNPFVNGNNFSSQFESFFGFNPDTNQKTQAKKSDNPLNTNTMFQSFFNPKKKKM